MSRGQLRFAIMFVVLVLLMGVGYRLMVTLRTQAQVTKKIREIAPDLAVTTEQRMQGFRRTKVRDGKKVWEIVARRARYSQDRQEVIVEGPEFSFYLKDGEMIALKSEEARVYLDSEGQEVSRVELKGNLEMRVGDFSIKTQTATFESTRNTIVSDGTVQIDGPGLSAVGLGYSVDVAEKRLTLNADVQTTISKGEPS
ncbi:MAG: LPS export ABC transporter periplasmic protein LptC [Deltaproteobacteria bacterium]|nr:LPS export ABC transporter periplasmic protein LptC [Deltaproteobacteria bacterium]